MIKKEELIQRSPMRILEQSIHGGLNPGEIGIIASLSGIGKTSVLVQLALDKLLQGKKVIHVSFSRHTDHVLTWYEDIFNEFIGKKNIENAAEIKDELVKNRVLMNFNQDGITQAQVLKSLKAMIVEGGFAAEAIIIDGFDFSRADQDRVANVKAVAKELGLSVWYSCTAKEKEFDKQNIPFVVKDFVNFIDVVIVMEPKHNYIELSVSKYREPSEAKAPALRLDPKTLLIKEKE